MFPYLRLGPYLIQTTGLALLIGLWVGLTLSEREAGRLNLKTERISIMIFLALISGIVVARLAYAAQFAAGYLANPLSLLSLNTNTLSPNADMLAGLLIAVFYGYRARLPLRPTLDALTPGFSFFMITLGVAHLLNGSAFGASTRLPWAIFLWSDYRHPTQIYETILALATFGIVVTSRFNLPAPGLSFIRFTALTSIAHVFLDAFRGDSVTLPGGFRADQVIGLLVLLACILLMREWAKSDHPAIPADGKA